MATQTKKKRKPAGASKPDPVTLDLYGLMDLPPWEWPKRTGPGLLALLQDRQAPAGDRLMAANLIVEALDLPEWEAPFRALLGILADPEEPEDLRREAAIALGPTLEEMDSCAEFEFEDVSIPASLFREAQATLLRLWQAPDCSKDLRRRVLESSVRAPEDWHVAAVRMAQASGDPEWRLSAAFSMRFVMGFDQEILEFLRDPDPAIHREAVLAAGAWNLESAWPHVRSLLESTTTSKDLLLAAIEAAPALGPEEAGECLIPLMDAKDEDIAEAAMEAMAILDPDGFLDEGDDDCWEDEFFKELEEEHNPHPLPGNVLKLRR